MVRDSDGWEPLSVCDATDLLQGVEARWWIAGGWALDLHLGRQTRHHHDIDVLVLREDLPTVRERLRGCDLHKSRAPRPQDVAYLHAVVGSLDATRRDWLRRALTMVDPGNGWVEAL